MNASVKLSATLIATLCLTGCATMFSDRWKLRVEGCRQADKAEIADAPDKVPDYVPFSSDLLGVIVYERDLDRIEWECIRDL